MSFENEYDGEDYEEYFTDDEFDEQEYDYTDDDDYTQGEYQNHYHAAPNWREPDQ